MLTRRRLLHSLPLAALAGCEKPLPAPRYRLPDQPIEVVTTTVQAADLVRNIGGKAVSVRSLIPPSVNPHLWNPNASEVAAARLADVFFLSGLGLESAVGESPAQLREGGLFVGVLANGLEDADILLQTDGKPDPHFWMDPRLWGKAGQEVAAVLTEALPDSAAWFADRAHAWMTELNQIHASTLDRLTGLAPRHRFLLSTHDSLAYLGKAFELEVRSLGSAAGEAPPKAPDELAHWVSNHQVTVLFREFFADLAAVKALARPLRLNTDPVVYALSLGNPGSKVMGIASEMRVDEWKTAFLYTMENVFSRLKIS